jgi:hypothetical protein
VQAIIVEVPKGPMAFSLVDGRYPNGLGEIALGATTLSQTGAHIGSKVPVTIFNAALNAQTSRLEVVGTIAFPPQFGTGGFGIGAVVTVSTAERLACPPGAGAVACLSTLKAKITTNAGWDLAIGTAPDRAGRATVAKLESQLSSVLTPASVPTDLANFGQAVNFPALLGATLAIFGAAALAHLLFVSVARRRREVAILKVLGFVRAQVGAAVCWQSTTIAIVGIVLGVPVGIAAGRVICGRLPRTWAWCPSTSHRCESSCFLQSGCWSWVVSSPSFPPCWPREPVRPRRCGRPSATPPSHRACERRGATRVGAGRADPPSWRSRTRT